MQKGLVVCIHAEIRSLAFEAKQFKNSRLDVANPSVRDQTFVQERTAITGQAVERESRRKALANCSIHFLKSQKVRRHSLD